MRWIAVLLLAAACGSASPPPPGEEESAQTAKLECNDTYWECYDAEQLALDQNGNPDVNHPCAPWAFGSKTGTDGTAAWQTCFDHAHGMCLPLYCSCKAEPSTACPG